MVFYAVQEQVVAQDLHGLVDQPLDRKALGLDLALFQDRPDFTDDIPGPDGVLDDVVDDLGSRQHIEYIHTILENGSGADRQLRVFRETGSLTEVAKYIHEETTRDLV